MAELFAKIDKWCEGKRHLRKLLADDIASPGKPQFNFFGIVPGANMSEASKQLGLFDLAMQKVTSAEAGMRAPAFAHLPHDQQERAARHVQDKMEEVRRYMTNTATAIGDANRAVSGRDAAIAQGGMNATKFVVEQAPDVIGTLVTAITHNKKLGDLAKNGSKIALREISDISNRQIGGDQAVIDKELGTFRDVAIDAVVDEVVGLLSSGAEKDKIKKAVVTFVVNPLLQAAAAAAKNDKGTPAERRKDAKEAAEKAFSKGVNDMTHDAHLPKLKNLKAVLEPIVAAVMGGVTAMLDGKPVKDGMIDALKEHGHDALLHGIEKKLDHHGHHADGEHHHAEEHKAAQHAAAGHHDGPHAAAHDHAGSHGAPHADAHHQHGDRPAAHAVAAHPAQGAGRKPPPSPAQHEWALKHLKMDVKARRRVA